MADQNQERMLQEANTRFKRAQEGVEEIERHLADVQREFRGFSTFSSLERFYEYRQRVRDGLFKIKDKIEKMYDGSLVREDIR